MEPPKSFLASSFSILLIFFLVITSLCELNASSSEEQHSVKSHKGHVVKGDQRRTLFDTEYGEISATDVKYGHETQHYHLQFFTLEPNSVFLPVLLHAAMVFYVHTGSGKLTWTNEDGSSTIDIREGDVGSLSEGSVFYIHSNLEAQRKKLRIYAMFSNRDDSTFDPTIGAYSRINELVKGFDKKIIQAAFKVPEDLVEAITNKSETQAIVHAVSEKKHNSVLELEASVLKYFIGIQSNSKKLKTYNIFDKNPDFKNCYGWTTTVTKKQLKPLKHHNIGFLMVNLTMGSMLGPHWNPLATEVAVVLKGEGMVRVVCGSNNDDDGDDECKNKRFRVMEGDVFVVPRFHPMAQMSFDTEPLVFMGFSTAAKKNHPQFLAGKESVLQILDKQIVATSLGVSKTTIEKLLESPDDSIIFECSSCAEEEERLMEEEKEKEKEEEEKRKREEEKEEEDKKREEEEKERERRRKREEEEEVRRREEERKREEEEARRQQEERERRREEEEAKREEEARREQEEARRQREKEREEEARRQREERKEEEEREEAEAREQKEKREEAQREEEEARRQQEKRERKEEEAREREREEKEEEARREIEEATRKQQEKGEREEEVEKEKERRREEAEREEEEAKREQEKREKRREEREARREEERTKREQERSKEEEAEREEEEAKREQQKRERRREEREARREEERTEREQERSKEAAAEGEEEAARRQQEKRERRREEGEARREEQRRRKERTEREQEERSKEATAEGEEEAARRQQEKRERRREEGEARTEQERRKREEQEEEAEAEGERGGGRRRQKRRESERRSREEASTEWDEEDEEAAARRQQEERERRREQDSGSSFEGRSVLKIRRSV